MEELKRQYAYFHRVLLELLSDLVAEEQVHWLSDKQGHIPKPEGEANSYRKALYVMEELEPLLVYGNYEIFSERAWEQAKA